MAGQADPGSAAKNRDEERNPVGIDAARGPPRRAAGPRSDQALDLDEERPRSFEGRRHDTPRRRTVVLGEEGAGRVGDLGHPSLPHLENADLLGRAESVLRGAQEADRRIALALEREDRIDEMLERLRPGDRAILRHVSDEDDGDPGRLRELHQPERRATDLADAAGGPIEVIDRRRLHRVDDEEGGSGNVRRYEVRDPVDRRLGDDVDGTTDTAEQAETFGA